MRVSLAVLWVLVLGSASFAAEGVKGRAFSLNALAASAKAGSLGQAQNLHGITRVLGYAVDVKNQDVVVFGKVDPSLPALHLDDLAVALRNAWGIYAQVEGKTRYYSYPGCSIDPDPNVLRELSVVQRVNLDFSDKDALEVFRERWKEVGSRPQKVRVMGVPFDSRFAKVMVDADFYMKRLVNGSVRLEIEGFESLIDIRTEEYRRDFLAGGAPAMSLNRFWFSPGETTYEEKNGMVLLRDCSVCLLTEEEFLSQQGAVKGKGRPDALAGRFAESFSAHYAEIANARPIYHELEALFRFAALAQLMKGDRAEQSAKAGLSYLLRTHKPKVVPVSRAVKGLADVIYTEQTVETAEGTMTLQSLQSYSGGVSMAVKPRRINTTPSPASKVAATPSKLAPPSKPAAPKNAVISARKTTAQVSWDIPLQDLE